MKIKVLKTRKFKAGYEVRDEMVQEPSGCPPFPMKSAYNSEGHYIGSSKDAYRICKLRGIRPELRTPESDVCSIGFCAKEQKWYGWSHRAMFGFGVGSKLKKGDCGYETYGGKVAKTLNDAKEIAKVFAESVS